MKKLFYSVTALLTILIVGCTKFEEPVAEKYAPAPDFSIDTLVTVADSSATFKICIDKINTTRFAVALLDEEVMDLDLPEALTLLKGNVTPKDRIVLFNADTLNLKGDTTITYISKNLLVSVHGDSISYTYTGLQPNTDYTFVAVVSNKFGMVGDVKSTSITTTDLLAPVMGKATRGDTDGVLSVAFSEAMKRGEGKVTAMYYAPYDFSITGTIPPENIHCEIDGKNITFTCDSVPAGALVLISWEAGAFKDIKGNNCNATVTEVNMTTGTVDNGCFFMTETEPFSFALAGIEDYSKPFVDYKTFKPSIGYSKPLYINYDPEDDSQPEITIYYAKDDVVSYMPVTWDVNDTAIVLAFSKEMEYGAKISFTIPAGAVVDAFGNPNKEFKVDDAWMRSYGLTINDVLGLYDVAYVNNKGAIVNTSMLISRSGSDPKKVVVSRWYYDSACLNGYFDGDLGILFIEDMQYMGQNGAYEVYFATAREDGYAQLQYNPETKSFSSDMEAEIYRLAVSAGSVLGYFDYTTEVLATYADDQTITYNYTKDLMVGDYRFIYHSYFDSDPESLDTITCVIEAIDDTTLIIKDFYFPGSEMVAYFDSVSGKLSIPDWQLIGQYAGYDCYNSTYDLTEIPFSCSPDGTAMADATESENEILWGILLPDYGNSGAWLELSEGNLYLEPYEPEPAEPEASGVSMRQSFDVSRLHTDMVKPVR